jgi:hypothetical protein
MVSLPFGAMTVTRSFDRPVSIICCDQITERFGLAQE